jgi:hypothetical protein
VILLEPALLVLEDEGLLELELLDDELSDGELALGSPLDAVVGVLLTTVAAEVLLVEV